MGQFAQMSAGQLIHFAPPFKQAHLKTGANRDRSSATVRVRFACNLTSYSLGFFISSYLYFIFKFSLVSVGFQSVII